MIVLGEVKIKMDKLTKEEILELLKKCSVVVGKHGDSKMLDAMQIAIQCIKYYFEEYEKTTNLE